MLGQQIRNLSESGALIIYLDRAGLYLGEYIWNLKNYIEAGITA
jgi:hypothetical protein